jgi:hypothetical protein
MPIQLRSAGSAEEQLSIIDALKTVLDGKPRLPPALPPAPSFHHDGPAVGDGAPSIPVPADPPPEALF